MYASKSDESLQSNSIGLEIKKILKLRKFKQSEDLQIFFHSQI